MIMQIKYILINNFRSWNNTHKGKWIGLYNLVYYWQQFIVDSTMNLLEVDLLEPHYIRTLHCMLFDFGLVEYKLLLCFIVCHIESQLILLRYPYAP